MLHCFFGFLSDQQRGWDSYIVYLFDRSLTKYLGPLTARTLPESVNFIGMNIFVTCIESLFI